MGFDVMTMIFWSVMLFAFTMYTALGWEDIEEWWWLRGTRKEIRLMERDSRRTHVRQED